MADDAQRRRDLRDDDRARLREDDSFLPREDGLTRDRIGGIARGLGRYVQTLDESLHQWQRDQEAYARRRLDKIARLGLAGLVLLAALLGANVFATFTLNGNRVADVESSRLEGYRSACVDRNDFNRSIALLAVRLGAPQSAVSGTLPLMPDCDLYATRRFAALRKRNAAGTFSSEARRQVAAGLKPPPLLPSRP